MEKYDHRKCTFIYLKQSICAHIHGNGHFFINHMHCAYYAYFSCVFVHTQIADLENEYVPHRTHKWIPHKEQNAIKDAISTCYNTEQ